MVFRQEVKKGYPGISESHGEAELARPVNLNSCRKGDKLEYRPELVSSLDFSACTTFHPGERSCGVT